MRYFVFAQETIYADSTEHVFDTEKEVLDFIEKTSLVQKQATFRVIFGKEIKLEPVEVVRSWRFKKE